MMTLAEREELFRRFQEKSPSPQTELEYSSPYTLLVAVVLSAQATDVGVNKATGPLFAVADTPAKIVALGEEKVRDYIKTIGLYRNKAKNVMKLSRILIDKFDGGPVGVESLAASLSEERGTLEDVIEADILVIDEALNTGDAQFRARTRSRIDQLREQAGCVFLVSHSMSTIQEMCTRAIWIEQGVLTMDSGAKSVTRTYARYTRKKARGDHEGALALLEAERGVLKRTAVTWPDDARPRRTTAS